MFSAKQIRKLDGESFGEVESNIDEILEYVSKGWTLYGFYFTRDDIGGAYYDGVVIIAGSNREEISRSMNTIRQMSYFQTRDIGGYNRTWNGCRVVNPVQPLTFWERVKSLLPF